MGSQRVGHDLATKPPFKPPPYITYSIFSVIIWKSTGHLKGLGGCCPNCPSSSYSRPCIMGFGQFKLCHSTYCEVTPSLPTEIDSVQFSSVQSLSCVWLFATPWITACQASLSITNSRSSLRLTSIESMMPSSHLILCRPLLLLPPIPPSIRVFSNEWTLCMRWPKYWSLSFSIIPSKEHPGLISFRMDWLDLLAVQGTLKSGKGQFSFQSQRKAMPKNAQTTAQLHSSHTLVK